MSSIVRGGVPGGFAGGGVPGGVPGAVGGIPGGTAGYGGRQGGSGRVPGIAGGLPADVPGVVHGSMEESQDRGLNMLEQSGTVLFSCLFRWFFFITDSLLQISLHWWFCLCSFYASSFLAYMAYCSMQIDFDRIFLSCNMSKPQPDITRSTLDSCSSRNAAIVQPFVVLKSFRWDHFDVRFTGSTGSTGSPGHRKPPRPQDGFFDGSPVTVIPAIIIIIMVNPKSETLNLMWS